MKRDRPSLEQEDDLSLRDAFRAVRSEFDGEREEADLTLQRALFQTRVQKKRQGITRWVLLPAAAALVASTAWAGVTGKLPSVSSMLEVIYEGRDRTPPAPPFVASHSPPAEPRPPPAPSAVEPLIPTEPPATAEAPLDVPSTVGATRTTTSASPSPSVVITRPAAPRTSAPTVVANAPPSVAPPTSNSPAPSSSANDPHAELFADAHRLHFAEHDPARALAAWDKYLDAAPTGRFAPEARYNRALALVRLGRRNEAQQELAVFANGMYGEYRRADAKALLVALARDASRP